MKNNQQFIKGAIATVIIAAIICVLTILAGDGMGASGGKLFSICYSLIFFGITGAISLVTAEKPEYKGLGTAGAIVSGLAFLMVCVLVLGDGDGIGQETGKFTMSLFIASIALGHICLLHHFNLQNKYAHTARTTATVFISIFSLILIVLIFGDLEELQFMMFRNEQATGKLLISSLIIDLAATLLVPLCNRLKTDEPVEFSFTEEEQAQKTAPAQPAEPVAPVQEEQPQAPLANDQNTGV